MSPLAALLKEWHDLQFMCRSLQYSHDSSSFSVENISDSLLQSEVCGKYTNHFIKYRFKVGRLTSSLKQLIADGAGADANFKSVEDVQESIDTFENLCTRIACERQRLSLLSRALRTSRRVSVDVKNELTSLCVCCGSGVDALSSTGDGIDASEGGVDGVDGTVVCSYMHVYPAIHRTP